MKKKLLIRIAIIILMVAWWSKALTQSLGPSLDPDREVIAMFRVGALMPPSGKTSGQPKEFQIPSQELRQLLQDARVEAISSIIPDFRPQDRFAVSKTGETVELTDWSRVYVLRVPSTQGREDFLLALRSRPEVVYAEQNGRGGPDLDPNDQYFNRQ